METEVVGGGATEGGKPQVSEFQTFMMHVHSELAKALNPDGGKKVEFVLVVYAADDPQSAHMVSTSSAGTILNVFRTYVERVTTKARKESRRSKFMKKLMRRSA